MEIISGVEGYFVNKKDVTLSGGASQEITYFKRADLASTPEDQKIIPALIEALHWVATTEQFYDDSTDELSDASDEGRAFAIGELVSYAESEEVPKEIIEGCLKMAGARVRADTEPNNT